MIGREKRAITAAESGRRVYYGTLAELIRSLEEAQAAGKLVPRLKTLTYPSLLVVDEIGYLPISRTGAMLFFQLIRRRYERASTVLTSNKSFEEWGEIFGDEVMAAALIDRLLHHCHIAKLRGNSYRMRHHATAGQAARARWGRGSAPSRPLPLSDFEATTRARHPPPAVRFRSPELSDFHPALTQDARDRLKRLDPS
jgi:hypothetical protein